MIKENILKKTGEIFLKFGFKSVTMDDIANDLGISKKTIYKYFKNKEDLVDQAVLFTHNECLCAIDTVCSLNYNAIQENFKVKEIFKDLLNSSDQSPLYQLEKYYPKTFKKMMQKEFLMFQNFMLKNIEKGMEEELYRKNINISIATKFYFSLIMAIHNSNFFTYNKNTINKLEIDALEYHIRAIATKKGVLELENQLAELNIK